MEQILRILLMALSLLALFLVLQGPLGLELPNCEEFEDPVFHVLQAVMILLENFGGCLQIELVVGSVPPRKLCNPLQKGPDDLIFG